MEEYRGRDIVVRFDGAKCIHSRHRVLEQPALPFCDGTHAKIGFTG